MARTAIRTFVAAAMVVFASSLPSVAQEAETEANPLQGFERVIGGRWYADDGSSHEFEWGVGRKVVRARSYRDSEAGPQLAAEGMWFFHPGDQVIRGVVVVVGDPEGLFEMETTFDGDTMTSRLWAYGSMTGEFREVFEFTDENHYRWTLFEELGEGAALVIGGEFERR